MNTMLLVLSASCARIVISLFSQAVLKLKLSPTLMGICSCHFLLKLSGVVQTCIFPTCLEAFPVFAIINNNDNKIRPILSIYTLLQWNLR